MTKAESAASRTPMVDNALIDNGELVGKFPEWVRADLARALELEAADLRSCIKDLRERLAKAETALEEISKLCGKSATPNDWPSVNSAGFIARAALARLKGEDHGNG